MSINAVPLRTLQDGRRTIYFAQPETGQRLSWDKFKEFIRRLNLNHRSKLIGLNRDAIPDQPVYEYLEDEGFIETAKEMYEELL